MKRVRRPRHLGSRGTFVVVAAALVMVMTALSALAVHDLTFQLDGDTDPTTNTDGGVLPYDWETFFEGGGVGGSISQKAGSLPTGYGAVGFAAPPGADLTTDESGDYHLPDKTVFATGSKDTLNISTGWECKKANNVGDKVDILNAYSAIYTDPGSGHVILYFGIEKSSPNGDSNVAIWFLQDPSVGCTSNGGGQPFTGDHQDGDLLLVSAFTNGGTQANVAAYEWTGGDAAGHLNENPVATGGLCGTDDHPNTTGAGIPKACAITNESSSIDVPWKSPDKNGGDLDALEFFEGAVDLTATGLGNVCFSKFLGNTRSSQSLTATIFDFAEGELDDCNPATNVTPSFTTPSGGTAHYGDNLTLTITEQNTGNTPLTLAFLGKTTLSSFVTTDNTDCNSTLAYASGDNGNGVLDIGETWTYTCTITAPNAPAVPVLGDSLTVTATGRGYDPTGRNVTYFSGCVSSGVVLCDANEQQSTSINLINPTTALTKTVSAVVTFTYNEHNDGNDPLTNVFVTDPGCTNNGGTIDASLQGDGIHNVGDVNDDNELDPGETWTFTCEITLDGSPAVDLTSSAIGHGLDSLGEDVTFCPTQGVTPTLTICDDQEVDSTRVLLDDITARPTPTPAPSP